MTQRAQLIYLMDPQCGWCFGYSGIIRQIVDHYKEDERVELSLVTGGLFHPARTTGSEFANDKRPIAERVSRFFGVTFSEAYFANVLASGHLDSLPPCHVINATKIMSPGAEFDMATRLIEAAFVEGRDISQLPVCIEVAEEGGHAKELLAETLASSSLVELTESSFGFAQKVGTGFPSIFLNKGGQLEHLGGTQLDLASLRSKVDVAIEET